MNERFTISKDNLENILNYLSTKPYREVAQIISAIQRDVKPYSDQNDALPTEDSE